MLDNFANSYGINGGLTTKSALTNILDNDDIPKVTLKTTGELVSEGGVGHLKIDLDHISSDVTTVTLQLGGNALALAKAGGLSVGGQPLTIDSNGKVVVTIPALSASVDVSVKFDDDSLFSGDKSLSAKILSANTNNTNLNVSNSGDDGAASIKVKDVPPTVKIEVTDTYATVVEKGDIHYKISLSTPSNSDTVIKFALNGTATKGVDYSVDGSIKSVSDDGKTYYTITIPKGEPDATFTVHANEDFVKEGGETVIATITSAKTNGVQLISSGENHEGHDEHDEHDDHDEHSSITSAPSAIATIADFNHAATFDTGTYKDQGSVTEDSPELILSTNGKLTVADLDVGESIIVKNSAAPKDGTLGSLTIDENGNWSYSVDNDKVQYLGADEHKDEVFTVKSVDGTPQTISITINGSNDAAVISGTSTGNVTELGGIANATQPATTSSSASGTLAIADVDSDESFTAVAVPEVGHNGTYGNFTLSTAGAWTYSLDNSNSTVQALNTDSDAITDSITVYAADGTPQTISITINGSNETPTVVSTLADQHASNGTPLSYIVPAGTFSDIDTGDVLALSAKLSDGSNLPSWLEFDQNTGVFSGTPPASAPNTLDIKVTATDTHSASTFTNLHFTIENDGILVAVENAVPVAPNGVTGDGNGDGIVDSLQSTVASLPTTTDPSPQTWVTIEAGGNLSNVSVSPAPANLPAGVSLPFGEVNFSVNVPTGVLSVDNSVYLSGTWTEANGVWTDSVSGSQINGYWKQGEGSSWNNVATNMSVSNGKLKIDFTLTDGDRKSDQDATVNGTIVDPGGPGLVIVNRPVAFASPEDSNSTANSVAENSALGTSVNITANAVDPDAASTVTYSLVNSDGSAYTANLFQINSSTGIVSTGSVALNYEAATSQTIYVRATSSDASTAIQDYTVAVTNVNEPVAFVTPVDSNITVNSVAENSAQGTTVNITANAVDPDAASTVTYSLVNSDGSAYTANLFQINSSTGIVSTGSVALNYEAATSQTIYVRATSSDASTAIQDYTVAVTNVDEAGALKYGSGITIKTNSGSNSTSINKSLLESFLRDPEGGSISFREIVSYDSSDEFRASYSRESGNVTFQGSGTHNVVIKFLDAQGNSSNITISYTGGESNTSSLQSSGSTDGVIIKETAVTSSAILKGGLGDDVLVAFSASEQLWGGLGNDTLTGSGAADKFVFNTTPNSLTNVDTITDFLSGTDKLWFSKTTFSGLGETGTGGGTAINANEFLNTSNGAETATTRFIYDANSGALSYDADGNGAGASIQVAIIGTSSHPTVVATDIQVIL
ncbi:cadherin domain-containing protein [Polynucleobacter sp. VK25]|uniref:VCBS domain-containing protein n=1 Tax=Polynucleobacter sp. VK25 TaxID=1758398 RepID=UPI001BFE52D4|nr:VCBS domain-containing protein [Polynucleobacter sp. VK25]QWD67575.1 cadherin domain-containing protein [Polynucleobacter sp. VK25]